jgi:hypothetical protein
MPDTLHLQTIEVTAVKIKHGYKYLALMPDGGRIVVRRRATRLYDYAFVYETGSGNGLGPVRYFSFGKNPDSYRKLIKTFKVKEVVA